MEDLRWAWGEQVCGMWYFLPSMLWHCLLGDKKGIRPVKRCIGMLMVTMWLEHCTSYNSSCLHRLHCPCCNKSRTVPFWYTDLLGLSGKMAIKRALLSQNVWQADHAEVSHRTVSPFLACPNDLRGFMVCTCRLYWTRCTSISHESTSCKRTTSSACAGTRSTLSRTTRLHSSPSPPTRTSRSRSSRSTTIRSLKAFATTVSADGISPCSFPFSCF